VLSTRAVVHEVDGARVALERAFGGRQVGCELASTGPSGSGKSTLLNLLGGLDHPTSGEVVVDGVHLERADDRELTLYRRLKLGIVFQFFNLLPSMSVVENVELPLLLRGDDARASRTAALEMLGQVGMERRATHFPHQLSCGEMQRAAIARGLVHGPSLLLADEPTGNLDSANASQVLEVIAKIASRRTATVIMVTHSDSVAALADRRIRMKDGRVAHDTP
jgi:putative ABC transport system ATP-binding protein